MEKEVAEQKGGFLERREKEKSYASALKKLEGGREKEGDGKEVDWREKRNGEEEPERVSSRDVE